MIRIICVVLFTSLSIQSTPVSQFRVIKEWNFINYTWLDYQNQSEGEYIPQNNLIAGINFYNGYYYLAIPRMKTGIPVTLARINSANPRPAPLLEPFPSWEFNELGNCEVLQNVQNVAMDAQGKMWIIDGGRTGTLTETPDATCSPKIVIYDLKQKKVLLKYVFPEEVANKSVSFLYDIVVDNLDGGYAYITDNSRVDPGLIVFSLQQNSSWKIRDSKTMRADPSAVVFRINNEVIKTPINIAGIALGPKTNINEQNITLNEDRQVFYSPISSLHLYSVSTSYLKNKNLSEGEDGMFSQYVKDLGIKAAQCDGMTMDNKGILYYGLLSVTSIARWDSSTPFSSGQQIISRDANYIQWPNSLAFDDAGNILVLTNSLEKYVQDKMSLSEPNFRILMAYVDGKSYAYDEETLVYSVYETDNQNIITKPPSNITDTMYIEEESITSVQETTTIAQNVPSSVSTTSADMPTTSLHSTVAIITTESVSEHTAFKSCAAPVIISTYVLIYTILHFFFLK